jgi:hypothetical protein
MWASRNAATSVLEKPLTSAMVQDFGLILQPNVAVRPKCHDFDTLPAHLRASIGAPIVDAALAVGTDAPFSGEPAPVAVMPVWAFAPSYVLFAAAVPV